MQNECQLHRGCDNHLGDEISHHDFSKIRTVFCHLVTSMQIADTDDSDSRINLKRHDSDARAVTNLNFPCLQMADTNVVAICEIYKDVVTHQIAKGWDSLNLAAASQNGTWRREDLITQITSRPERPSRVSEKRIAADPVEPMEIRTLMSTAMKLQVLKRLSPREKWHGFMQCVFQALAHVQLKDAIQWAEDNYGSLEMDVLYAGSTMYPDDRDHPPRVWMEFYLRRGLRLDKTQ